MRKFLAVLLAVMMLVGAMATTVSAADAVTTFDKTTKDTKIDLVITEILVNSKTGNSTLDDQPTSDTDTTKVSSPDAFDFIEIYNAGSDRVNLTNYTILAGPKANFRGEAAPYEFTKQNVIAAGVDVNSSAQANASATSANDYNECINPEMADMWLEPGAFAVIWFWTADTDRLCTTEKKMYGDSTDSYKTGSTSEKLYFPQFRDYWAKQDYPIAEDTLVVAVNAKGGTSQVDSKVTLCNFGLGAEWVYAIADKNSVNVTSTTPYKALDTQNKLRSTIHCMAEWSTRTEVGILTTEDMDNASSYYVPSANAPDLYNTNKKLEDSNHVDAVDYVAIKYARSYKETANVYYTADPTPGGMPAWQWMYVDSEGFAELVAREYTAALAAKASNSDYDVEAHMQKYVCDWGSDSAPVADIVNVEGTTATVKTDWATKVKAAFLEVYHVEIEEIAENEETKKNYADSFVDRAKLEEMHAQAQGGSKTTKDKFPVWALILIIVGGVLLVGGGVTVAIILIKKKNKPVAADDVAAEGEVQVIDETEATDAPVEEAPVEEAPAEEAPVEEDKE